MRRRASKVASETEGKQGRERARRMASEVASNKGEQVSEAQGVRGGGQVRRARRRVNDGMSENDMSTQPKAYERKNNEKY